MEFNNFEKNFKLPKVFGVNPKNCNFSFLSIRNLMK